MVIFTVIVSPPLENTHPARTFKS